MRKKWEPQAIVAVPHQVSDQEIKLRLAELAQIMYFKFRQLQELHTQDTCSQTQPMAEERTGTKYA